MPATPPDAAGSVPRSPARAAGIGLPESSANPNGILHAGRPFSTPELQVMARDGLLNHVYGASYVRPHVVVDAGIRARAAISLVPESLRNRVALGRQSAAWIYGCAGPPLRLSLLADHHRRTTALRPFSDAVLHEVGLGPLDITSVAGVQVTTPLRTAMDVALHGRDTDAIAVLRRISAAPGLDCPLELVLAAVEAAGRLPGKQAALARLREALGDGE
jgi:hypothetical protein